MSVFANVEPTFTETYKLILNCIKTNQIYIMDEDSWKGRLCWLKLIVNILAAFSHTAGVIERIGEGADLVQISTDLSAALIMWQVFYKAMNVYVYIYLLPRLVYVTIKHHILKESVVFSAPFYTKMPFRTDDNFLLYCLVYLADFKILLDVAHLVCFDLLLMNATMHHVRMLFVILQDDLRQIVQPGVDIEQTAAEMKLKKLIPRHQDLLKLMFELSNAFGAIFLIHLAFFSGTMCFFGFAARIQPSPESIKNLLASNIILVCIYSCCYYGQNLTDAGMDIANAAYDGYWHLVSQEYRRCILIIMLRSQKAQYIKSTSFINISLETFTKILNTTWSFLSLMTKIYEA